MTASTSEALAQKTGGKAKTTKKTATKGKAPEAVTLSSLSHKIENTRIAKEVHVVSGSILMRPALAISGNGTVNDFGIDGTNRFIVNTQPVDNPWSKPFQQDIRFINQAIKNLFACLGFQV